MNNFHPGDRVVVVEVSSSTPMAQVGMKGSVVQVVKWGGMAPPYTHIIDIQWDDPAPRECMNYSVWPHQVEHEAQTPFEKSLRSYIQSELY